jgi:uncharacterized protein
MKKIVIDTNIMLVILSSKSGFRWIFDLFLGEKISICVTTEILNEYVEIIGKRSGIVVAENLMNVLLTSDNVHFITKYFSWNLIQTDPDDNKFVDCAVACGADFILTEDKHFNILADIPFPKIAVVNKKEFAEIMGF